jgi:hypothetical protein
MAMSTDFNELVQGEQPSLQFGTDQDYRLLEEGYHQSAAYAAMVERYPLLRRTIAACRVRGWWAIPKHLPVTHNRQGWCCSGSAAMARAEVVGLRQ